jgi:transposase
MPTTRKSYSPSLKAKISVEAIKAQKTMTELAQLYHVNPNLIAKWKKQALAALPKIFRQPHNEDNSAAEAEKDELFKQIGQLKVELVWLKKRSGFVD